MSATYGSTTALDETKKAVKKFITALNANEGDLDHRVAVVGYSNGEDPDNLRGQEVPDFGKYRFGGTGVYLGKDFYRYTKPGYDAYYYNGLHSKYGNREVGVTDAAVFGSALKSIKTEMSTLTASADALLDYSGTNMTPAFEMAEAIINARTGEDAERPVAVVLFTDGIPGDSGFSMLDAADSVNIANRLKKQGVKIFTAGIVNSAFFDNDNDFANKSGQRQYGRRITAMQGAPATFNNTRMYSAPTYSKMFVVDPIRAFAMSSGSWARNTNYGSVGVTTGIYTDSAYASYLREAWDMSGNGAIMITTAQANAVGLENNFLARDLLAILSSDYENVSAGLYTMQEMYSTFGTGAAPTLNKANATNATLPDGYLWPIYANGVHWGYMDLQKCIAYYQENDNALVAGDYWRAALYNGTANEFTYTDGVKGKTKKFSTLITSTTDSDFASKLVDLTTLFEEIETVIESEVIVSGGAGNAVLDSTAVLCDQLSELFMIDSSVEVEVYTQAYAGKDGENHKFNSTRTPYANAMIQYDTASGKVAVSGFDYTANYVHVDSEGNAKGCRLLVVVKGVLAKEDSVGANLATNNEVTSGMYPGKGPSPVIEDSENPGQTITNPDFTPGTSQNTAGGEGSIIPADPTIVIGSDNEPVIDPETGLPKTVGGELPGEYPEGSTLIFPLPRVDIEEQIVVYDFSNRIELGVSSDRGIIVHSLAKPFEKIASVKSEIVDEGISVKADLSGGDAEIDIRAIETEDRGVAALMQYDGDALLIEGREVDMYKWKRITVLPATNVHYEESYLTYSRGSEYAAAWDAEGTALNPVYNVSEGTMIGGGTARQSSENTIYGYDATYGAQTGDSNGRSMHVQIGMEE